MDSVELGQLVREFMLRMGENPSWFMRAEGDGKVRWVTDGIASSHDGLSVYRLGLASISVDGASMKVLRQVVEELEWNVTLYSSAPAKFGPESVTIQPDKSCFGSSGSGCNFEVLSTLKKAGVRIQSLCRKLDRGNGVEVFAAQARGRQPAWLLYWTSAGSGGQSNWLTIYWNREQIEDEARACLSEAGVA